jgi:hypothetical protein
MLTDDVGIFEKFLTRKVVMSGFAVLEPRRELECERVGPIGNLDEMLFTESSNSPAK